MKFYLLLFFIFSIQLAKAQNFSLTGTVKDDRGQEVPGAGIYISGSKTTTLTDVNGNFKFATLPVGNYDILIQMMGFQPKKVSVSLLDKNENLKIVLEESTVSIKEVVIKPDPDREYYLATFKKYFIGVTENAATCKILNPNILTFDYDKTKLELTVTASEFLVIENKALGYKIKYLLQNFVSNFRTNIVYYEGYPTFEEMKAGKSREKNWANARAIAYNGSSQHYYRALANNTSIAEGFITYKLNKIPNNNRPPDAVIEPNIKRLMKGQAGLNRVISINGSDSLSYWMKKRNEPKELAILSQQQVQMDTLVRTYSQDVKYMLFTGELYVIYTKETEAPGYQNTGYYLSRPPNSISGQISQIRALKLPIAFYSSGNTADPTSTLSSGYFAYQKMADQVPIEYQPPKK